MAHSFFSDTLSACRDGAADAEGDMAEADREHRRSLWCKRLRRGIRSERGAADGYSWRVTYYQQQNARVHSEQGLDATCTRCSAASAPALTA